MSSSVFFKFKSQKEPSRVTFDGTGISVFELKRSIIEINRLGDGSDFDLAVYNEDTNEEYDDDTTIIPRSTSIIARRLPPAKPGRGSAARYVSGKMPVNARNSSRMEAPVSKVAVQGKSSTGLSEMSGAQTEEEKIAAMFKAGADQWEQQQQEMANATPVHRNGPFKGKPANVPDHPPPPGYICYRCGEKGHWIQVCPTNNDPNFDGRPRVKRTTGIPRSFLKTVERPAALSGDGATEDVRQPSGVMVNAEGEFVIAEPDKASWEQYQAKTKLSAAAQAAAVSGSKELQELGLECPVDKRMFVDPMKTPCCGRTYCNDCITNALIDSDLKCPGCQTEGVLIDNLVPDDEATAKLKQFLEEKEIQKKEKENENEKPRSPSDKPEKSPAREHKSASPVPAPAASSAVPAPSESNPKKRPAEEELENKRIPDGPAAMQKQKSAQQDQCTPKSPANKAANPPNGFPNNMPFNVPDMFANGNMFPPGMNPMDFQAGNWMGMPGMGPMGMNPGMMGMGMPPGGYWGGNGAGWGNQGGMGFPQQVNGMYGNVPNGMIPNGFNPMMNGMAMPSGMAQQMPNGPGMGFFPNQQKTVFGEATPSEEDTAYFRKPVNPHRHQSRQRRVRPSDYREL